VILAHTKCITTIPEKSKFYHIFVTPNYPSFKKCESIDTNLGRIEETANILKFQMADELFELKKFSVLKCWQRSSEMSASLMSVLMAVIRLSEKRQ